jgi:hypothetical protein
VAPSSGLRGKGLKISAATPPAAPAGGTGPATAEPAEAKPSGLVGKLVGRLTGRTRG